MGQLLPVSEEDDARAGDIPGRTLYPTLSGGILTAPFPHVLPSGYQTPATDKRPHPMKAERKKGGN